MKKFILMLGVIFLVNLESKAQQEKELITINSLSAIKPVSFSMNAYSGPGKDADFYLRRSKNYRIVGWTTLGAGLVASGVGLILATNSNKDVFTNNGNDDAAAALFLVGAVSGITSIPFMIMASSYKHKAKAMVSSQKTGFGVPGNVSKDIVGITLQIPLGK